LNKVVLVITDGIGHKTNSTYNAFENAKTPTYDKLFKETPYSLIATHGEQVGLPDGQMGNSEVGHMTIGSGRVLYQDLVKISKAIEDKSFTTLSALQSIKKVSGEIHLVGLLSDGGVHSHINHIIGFAQELAQTKKVHLHLISDGRDVSPTSVKNYLTQIEAICNDQIEIATIGGRFYTMDRDTRWDRVLLGYNAIVEASPKTDLSVDDYVDASYGKEEYDEFIVPVAFNGYQGIADGDGVVIMNFRSDRVRQISELLANPAFTPIEVNKRDITLITMTEYSKEFNFEVLFPKSAPKNTLAETVSKSGARQFHTAETEKYAHVTFFMNGGIEEPYLNETRALIASPDVKTYDLKPEMSANEVGDAVIKAMDQAYELVIVNFANGDMVGHTGNYEAALTAVNTVDTNLARIVESCDRNNYKMVLTSDHGNCEEMKSNEGKILTNHTVGEVYCFVRSEGVSKVEVGGLNNIAPTVLKLMGLEIPSEMDNALI
jgi:2,3-bisphosphoglycerate-independent phosphoglycerate mutase